MPARRTAPHTGGPASNPLNVLVGNLFYGTEGWAAMSDQGFQAYKGESSELIMEERPERGPTAATPPRSTCRTSCRPADRATRRNCTIRYRNACLSAELCHLANISYRVGRKLTIEPGPKFGDAEANKMLTRNYRKPYVV